MRNYSACLLSMLAITALICNPTLSSAQTIRQDWHREFPVYPPADQSSARAVVDPDGSAYWAVNNQDSVASLKYIWLEKVDSLNHVQFAVSYFGTLGAEFTDMKSDHGGNIYLYGINYGGSLDGSNTAFLNKYNSTGSLLWSINFDFDLAGEELPDQIYISPINGDVVATASENSPQGLLLGRFTPDGNQVWAIAFGDYEAGDILIDQIDRIHLTATYHFLPGDTGRHFAYLLLNGDGSVVNGFTQIGGDYSFALRTGGKGRTLGIDESGNFYCLSWVNNFPSDSSQWTNIMMYKFDNNGNQLWSKRLEHVHSAASVEQSTLLVDNSTGGIAVVSGTGLWRYLTNGTYAGGYFTRHRSFVDGMMFNREKTFALSCGDIASGSDSGKITHFDWSNDDSTQAFYASGRASIQFLNSTAIVEPDSIHYAMYVTWSYKGKVSLHRLVLRDTLNTFVSEIANQENEIEIYPNPASGFINVAMNNNSNEKVVLQVLDLSGKVMITKAFQDWKNIQLAINDLSAGMYQVIITEGSNRYVKKLVVE